MWPMGNRVCCRFVYTVNSVSGLVMQKEIGGIIILVISIAHFKQQKITRNVR